MAPSSLTEVRAITRDAERFRPLIGDERTDDLLEVGAKVAALLDGRSLLHLNSTAAGGGVAEMLHVLLPYARFAGVDARWFVIEGTPEFFAVTKRLHNHLYGTPGDGGALGEAERDVLRGVGEANAAEFAAVSRADDVVVLHDPQPSGLARALSARGLPVVWRCHVGTDDANDYTEAGWEFLRPLLEPYVDQYVFSRKEFAPDWVPADRLHVIPPSIDPFSAKNLELDATTVPEILSAVGLIRAPVVEPVTYRREDGSAGRVEHYADVFRTGPPPGPEVPLVVQVSRWDRMKDMEGVMEAFAGWVVHDHDAHLLLVGPSVSRVADDPEGAEVLTECWHAWRELPHAVRARVQLACLPMIDTEENAVMVNALQRHATVIVQKSLAEGFGLTVAEAMVKGRPIIASDVGGISDQIVDGRNGLLIEDPTDASEFTTALGRMLSDPEEATRMGVQAREDAVNNHLGDHHLTRWAGLLEALLVGG